METIEPTIVSLLLFSDKFFSKVIPFLDSSIFIDENLATFVKYYVKYTGKEKRLKLVDVIEKIKNDEKISKAEKERIKEAIKIIKEKVKELKEYKDLGQEINIDEFVKETEKYFKTRKLENAIIESAQRLEEGKGINLKKIEEAIGFSFDSSLGLIYSDVESKLKYYNEKETFFPTNVKTLDEMLGGGFVKHALYVFTGKTNIGKSLLLCSIAVDLVKQGYNVLYISGELSERMVLMRIDANVYDVSIKQLMNMDLESLRELFEQKKLKGELIIKDFPTSSTNTAQIRSYLDDLKMKMNFQPDFIIVDYITIFLSSRLPMSAMRDSYSYFKAVAEEFRGLAGEYDCCVITATQLNREGAKKKKIGSLDTTYISESFGVAFTADFQAILFQTDALREQNIMLMKVVKSRFDSNVGMTYNFHVDYEKMRIKDVDENLSDEAINEIERAKYEIEFSDEKPSLGNIDDLEFEEV